MLRFLFGTLGLMIFVTATALGQDSTQKSEKANPPRTAKVGIYITKLFGLSSSIEQYSADMWIWVNYQGKKENPYEFMEFFNSIETKQINRDIREHAKGIWDSAKYSNKIAALWDASNFPFDRHKLEIIIESVRPTREMVFEADHEDSGLYPKLELDEWKIVKTRMRVDTVDYPSKLGSPDRDVSDDKFSRVIMEIHLERDALSLFFKLHAGVYVAFAITMLSYLLHPASDDVFSGRISLIVGMLFASLVNMQIVDNTVGNSNAISLSDKIHIATMCSLFVSICTTIISRKLCEKDEPGWANRFDTICIFAQSFIYISINAFLIYFASRVG
ncbi:MAG: hypothetical protein ACK5E4_01325 [Planctomycetia bacterium]|jgi:hypothetical protein